MPSCGLRCLNLGTLARLSIPLNDELCATYIANAQGFEPSAANVDRSHIFVARLHRVRMSSEEPRAYDDDSGN